MKLGLAGVPRRHEAGRRHARGGLVWSYDEIGSSVSTVAIADGLVYAAGFDGRLHCLDAETGKCYWVHEAGGPIWGSPLVADGKVYLGTGKSTLWVLAAGQGAEGPQPHPHAATSSHHAHRRQRRALRGDEQAPLRDSAGGEVVSVATTEVKP